MLRSNIPTPFGNANAFWCIGVGLTSVFFASAQKILEGRQISTAFKIHPGCAGTTSLVCIWNLCFSPSQGPTRAMLHRSLGKLGTLTSLLGLACGYVAAWCDADVPRGAAIGLSCVGA